MNPDWNDYSHPHHPLNPRNCEVCYLASRGLEGPCEIHEPAAFVAWEAMRRRDERVNRTRRGIDAAWRLLTGKEGRGYPVPADEWEGVV